MYTHACMHVFDGLQPIRRFHKLVGLMLVAVMLLTSAGWAAAEASYQLDHGAAGTQGPLPSEHGKAPAHSCMSHLSAHLFAPLESPLAAPSLAHADCMQSMAPVRHAIAVPDGFFRPPRLFPHP